MDFLYIKMRNILKVCFNTGKSKLYKKQGCFELIGVDFMIDADFSPILIEFNTNPALLTDTITQREIIP